MASAAGTGSRAPAIAAGADTPGTHMTPKARASAAKPGGKMPGSNEPGGTAPPPSRRPAAEIAVHVSGMPRWLEAVLLGTGLLAAAAFATEPVAVLARRRRHRRRRQQKM
ncbi:MAG: hypothetical protein ACRDP7_08760 [Trebonia sp.]